MTISFKSYVSIQNAAKSELFYSHRFAWPRTPPIRIYPDQDISWADTALVGGTSILPMDLVLLTITDGAFVIGGGFDGVVLTKTGECVEETAHFTAVAKNRCSGNNDEAKHIPVEMGEISFDEVFLGFDSAWSNYFHWVCYALPKSYIAANILPATCQIILPDYITQSSDVIGLGRRRLAFSASVWHQSLQVAALAGRALLLPPGIYRANRIYTVWPRTSIPTDFLYADLAFRFHAHVRSKGSRLVDTPRRLFISRTLAPDNRISQADQKELEGVLVNAGFDIVRLEDFDFLAQVNLFYNAEIVVAPHGAGLTNLLFGGETLKILELNRNVSSESSLRPWFYMIASQRSQAYAFLNGTGAGFKAEDILRGVDVLLSTPR